MEARPTGRRRFRHQTRWLSKPILVLQVEWKGIHTFSIGGHIDSEWITFWRDADVADLTTEDKLVLFPETERPAYTPAEGG